MMRLSWEIWTSSINSHTALKMREHFVVMVRRRCNYKKKLSEKCNTDGFEMERDCGTEKSSRWPLEARNDKKKKKKRIFPKDVKNIILSFSLVRPMLQFWPIKINVNDRIFGQISLNYNGSESLIFPSLLRNRNPIKPDSLTGDSPCFHLRRSVLLKFLSPSGTISSNLLGTVFSNFAFPLVGFSAAMERKRPKWQFDFKVTFLAMQGQKIFWGAFVKFIETVGIGKITSLYNCKRKQQVIKNYYKINLWIF